MNTSTTHIKKQAGFTLIELLVVVSISVLTVSVVVSNFNNFNNNQRVKQAVLTLKNNLRLAQTRASTAIKPQAGCTKLVGYEVTFTATTYNIHAFCAPENAVGTEVFSLPSAELQFSPTPSTILFGVLTRGVESGTQTISVSGINGVTASIIVDASGEISEP